MSRDAVILMKREMGKYAIMLSYEAINKNARQAQTGQPFDDFISGGYGPQPEP